MTAHSSAVPPFSVVVPGQVLSPFGGLNEFLSALVMDSLLESMVRDVDLLIATACIEETIPFRGPDAGGRRPPIVLEQRISEVNRSFDLGLSDVKIRETVSTAVIFSNRDVYNFFGIRSRSLPRQHVETAARE